jgi:iron complex outermembrane receptor protein
MFLDLVQARTPFANVRAQGVDPDNGYAFSRNSPTGVGGLYMRTSNVIPALVGGPNQRVDANAAPFFPFFVGAANQNNALVAGIQQRLVAAGLPAQNAAALAGQIVTNLAAARPTAAQVGTVLPHLQPDHRGRHAVGAVPHGRWAPRSPRDEAPLEPNYVNNYEAGYKAIIADKFRIAVDAWYQQRFNFITPAQLISPTVFAEPTTLGTYIATQVAQTAAPTIGAQNAAALGQGVAQTVVPGLAAVPLGNVVPDGRRFQRNDVIFAYRNVDETINLWGSDLAMDYLITPRVTVASTVSFVNRGAFPGVPGGNGESLQLNAPRHKASLGLQYDSPLNGWAGELRYRYYDAFRVNSAVYLGDVPTNNFVDLNVSKAATLNGRRARISLNAQNVLNNRRPTFIGTPAIGRLLVTRVSYTL